ncbi:MAG TPA: M36 family metallopeptidase [Nocardioidaceae bacterium]|nr:M36 family metallopeptidase [Nocardioidaceae bacterium]
MPFSPRALRTGTALAAAGVILGLAQLPATGTPTPTVETALDRTFATWGDSPPALPDLDLRGSALPTAAQRRAVSALSATVRWNRFGTPSSILATDGDLGPATGGDEVTSARAWLRENRATLGISLAQVDGLELVSSQELAGSDARAVLFRQTFDGLSPAIGSMVTVGVADGRIVYVSSSLTRTTDRPEAARIGAVRAWQTAAAAVGRDTELSAITDTVRAGWTRLKVDGFAQEQQVRLRALAFADGTVRPVFEANVVDSQGGRSLAYTLMVDAVTGKVLHRENKVEHAAAAASEGATQMQGAITATECGPKHELELTDGETKQIVVTATAVNPANDIVVKIFGPDGEVLTSGDLGTSPETATYTSDEIPAGTYSAQVCPFDDPTVPFVAPGEYVGVITTSDSETPSASSPYPPRWSYFTANPALSFSTTHVPGNRVTGCWETSYQGERVEGCDTPPGALRNLASRGPWDFDFVTGLPTLTTTGNNAVTREAWASPLTPGGAQAPVSPARSYTPEFTDAWQNSKCDPANLVPGGNDIDASVTNLFVAHNRMHDYSYFLGFTEENYNMQVRNLGGNADPTRENDPEVGDAQAGALTGHTAATGLGRDNANQITLQDGIPGITNQYLFQPIAAAFYSPCTDGGFDMSIIGHEYTHAISNRMIGGPDEGITSEQGGAMGESWGDLVAAEYMISHGYATGSNPWAVGPYATGNKAAGIRDYPIDRNPLQYGDYGFDSTGPEVHADGEIWNGVQYDVRQALVRKYADRFPAGDERLQRRCASGTATSSPLPAERCPGNRRWIQLVFDSFLLQQGATSMLDARDAMLAADRMRFGGANQRTLWTAFARRGMGIDARTATADSHQPRPGYRAPGVRSGTVRLVARTGAKAAAGTFFVGRYEARVTPVADTIAKTALDDVVRLVPGTYDLVFRGEGTGIHRSRFTVKAGRRTTKVVRADRNLASKHAGAKVVGSSPGSVNAGSLIDDTEATNWAGVNEATSVDAKGGNPFVVVDLAGGRQVVRRVNVSAMLRPAGEDASDPDSGSRFTALRKFAIEVCTSGCGTTDARWKRIYTSPDNAFPAVRPRPVAPNLQLRSFDVPDTAATHVRFVALENQCTGFGGYAGEQDNDPLNDTDCKTASERDLSVRAAELQVFGRS